jgi:hypothetical protein
MINFGQQPHMGFEPQQVQSKLEPVNEFTDQMAKGQEKLKATITKAKDEYVMYYNHYKGNHNSLREQLSLKTNQGESKVNI